MERVAIIGGVRTPFVKAAGVFSSFESCDLLAHVLAAAWKKFSLDEIGLEEVVAGTVLHDPRVPNLAREAVFKAGLPKTIAAHSVSNNCITGLVAVNYAAESILSGRTSTALAGGAEAMSRPALLFGKNAQEIFLGLSRAKSLSQKLKLFSKFRPKDFSPSVPSPKEPSTGLTMGEHCELMVKEFKVSRQEQDELAFQSHRNAAKAQKEGLLARDIEPLAGVTEDNLIRANTTIEKLSALKPVFDRSASGTLTAGNSSALTDGASVVLLMAETKAKKLGLKIAGYLESSEFAAVNPEDGLLMGPALAVPNLLTRTKLRLGDVDLFEIHEAFSGQVLCNIRAWENGWSKYPAAPAIGKISTEKINLAGGSLALGHPFAATGGRLILSALQQLNDSGKNRALISVCAAGAMGAALTLTRN